MPSSPSDNQYEKYIFDSLHLSESNRKYIHITKDAVYFTFPIKLKLELWAGDKKLFLDKKAMNEISETIGDFFRYELSKGEFKDIVVYSTADPSERQEMEFYRDIGSEEEAIEAVQWLLEFRKRFGF